MSPLAKKLLLGVVIAQLLVLCGMIVQREYLLSTGREILLDCAPRDPRSLMSGDYVILRYKINTVSKSLNIDSQDFEKEDQVYVALQRKDGEKYHHAVAMSKEFSKLDQSLPIIQGKVKYDWANNYTIEYGIEQYFVPEGQGRWIETEPPENVSVVVNVSYQDGKSALKQLLIKDQPVQYKK